MNIYTDLIEYEGKTYVTKKAMQERAHLSDSAINKKLRCVGIKGIRIGKSPALWFSLDDERRIINCRLYTRDTYRPSVVLKSISNQLAKLIERTGAINANEYHLDSAISLIIGRLEQAKADTDQATEQAIKLNK